MTIVTQPYFFGHLDHLHKFRQWVKSAMFQPKSRRIPCIILWDSDQTTMCFMGQTCRSASLSLSYFGKAVIPNHSRNFVDHRCPHLTIQTSFSSSYSQHTPSLMTGRTLTTFLHPAIPGTFPFGDAGTNWWKFSATKSAPSAS